MTFPAYRHLLTLSVQSRHPQLADERRVRPFGFCFWRGDQPVAVALAEVPAVAGDRQPPQLLSVFVETAERHQGLARALVARVEGEVRSAGFRELVAVYTSGTPPVEWMERVFASRGWEAPTPQSLSVRFEPARALESPAFAPERLRSYGAGLEIVPWSEISAEEVAEIRRSDSEQRWVEHALNPWQFESRSLDSSSVGARCEGRVVGWVLNHRILSDVVRWSVAYVRPDLSRRARAVPLFHASLERIVERGDCRFCSFITPFSYPHMIRLIRRWIAPVSFFVEESRRIRRVLAP
jgi:GNAT superfamily N-acetyltransferase